MTRPPKKCQVPELWWNALTEEPRIVYPSGVIDAWWTDRWHKVPASKLGFRSGWIYEFICELK